MFQSHITVSVASKLRHAQKFLDLREQYPDVHFNSRWIVTASLGSEANRPVPQWMRESEMEIVNSHVLLVYAEAGEELKTALVQVGIAIANRVPIVVVGEHKSYADWQFFKPLVDRYPTLQGAMRGIKIKFRGQQSIIGRGSPNPIFGRTET